MQYLARDISTFKEMIRKGYLYVDKTKAIYDLYAFKDRYHFLSRPRRFGKSLLISTLKELFEGNRELFSGLWIDQSDFEWNMHPIVNFDFSTIAHRSPEALEISLKDRLFEIADHYQIVIEKKLTLEDQLRVFIKKLAEINKVVILIDEYDQPLLAHLDDLDVAHENREILHAFYKVIKGSDAHIRAIFITGVSKFSKTPVFSEIGNINDISMNPIGSKLLGNAYAKF